MLCSICQSIFEGELRSKKFTDDKWVFSPISEIMKKDLIHYQGTVERHSSEMCSSALQGCCICDSMSREARKNWKCLERRFGPRCDEARLLSLDVSSILQWEMTFEQDSFLLTIDARVTTVGKDVGNFKWLEIVFACSPIRESTHHDQDKLHDACSLELATKWLNDCTVNHVSCTSERQTKIPTRLLKVESPRHGFVQLTNTDELPANPRYMTLSHGWELARFMKLEADTSFALYQVLEWSISLKLSGRRSKNSNESCYEKEPQLVEPWTFTTRWTDHPNAVYSLQQSWPWREDIEKCELLNRGWVVQEQFLSPRILYLGKRQMFWECHSLQAYQTYTRGIPTAFFYSVPLKSTIDSNWSILPPGAHASLEQLDDLRSSSRNVVRVYSRCQLTQGDDKLIAISGIAKCFRGVLDDHYLAGLWRADLPVGLLWSRTHTAYCEIPKSYQAPSWSWVSIIGEVESPPSSAPDPRYEASDECSVLASVLEVSIETAWGNSFGKITSGWIRMVGHLITIKLDQVSTVTSSSGSEIVQHGVVQLNGEGSCNTMT
ncbi:hypothetical protein DL98DRAFT_525169 [Cadophora sp. DSE1049]|nr:hypothetical protein DL98DRAFT_525169 [Cadophora sp. DSE1049]